MKAIICRQFGSVDQLEHAELALPPLMPHEVRVRVHAAGVNFPDSLKVEGKHQIKPPLPWVPGSETGGVVEAVGEEVRGLQPGERVMGVSDARGGGFAEQIVLDAARVFTLPAGMSFEEAAATPVVYGTTLYALKQRGRLAAGEWLLVLGAAGGVGLATVQLGKAMGARVIAAASTPEKRALCLAHGADHAIDYTQSDWREEVKALTGGHGADVIYDPVGGDAFDEAVRCMAFDGRYLVIGFTSGRIPQIRINYPLVKGFDILGVRYDVWRDGCWSEARANLQQVLDFYAQGRVRPLVSGSYALPRAVEAMRSITSRNVTGKLVLVNG
ncbi:NADPH:quinone oxidoreductase family protein [Xenophilus arseniciresistens]|uniref:NADPH:quinone oxidoreductase family protein n=1 Tax=Xenophilus arseniciresistens TaxID=1283306 RepID=A0AAE3NCD3_9BURK|nr:NADPH:quinone oxidoreductase family protein [Xenophilus arseniciresistens]MDA7418983.1 NADPH:quinone oxidoreductase family protein [Xenophilus arseniciresistens]